MGEIERGDMRNGFWNDAVPEAGAPMGVRIEFTTTPCRRPALLLGSVEHARFCGFGLSPIRISFGFRIFGFRIYGLAGVAHDGEAALGEDVHFDEADGFDGVHVEMGGGPAFVRDEGGGEFAHRLSGKDDAAGMHLGMTRETIEEGGGFDGGAERFFLERQVAAFGAGLEFLDQFGTARSEMIHGDPTAAEAPGEMFGEPADLEFGDAEDFGDVADGAAGLEGGEPADDGAMVGAVFIEEQIDDVVFAVVREIDIDIGEFMEGHPFLVEEAAEIKSEADGADVRDAEAITDETVGGAAAGDPFDAMGAAGLEEVPGDEEEILVTDLGDDGEFGFDLGLHGGEGNGGAGVGKDAAMVIAAMHALGHEPAQGLFGTGTVGRAEGGELRFAERELELATVGDLAGMIEPIGMIGTAGGEFGWCAEMVTAAQALLRVTLPEQGPGADGLDDIESRTIGGGGITGPWSGHGGQGVRGQMGGGDLVETTGKKRRQGRITADGDQTVGERFEQMPRDGRSLLSGDGFIGVRCGMVGEQFAEVGVAAGVFDVEQERMRSAGGRSYTRPWWRMARSTSDSR